MIKLWGILKGLLIQDSTDRSKQLSVEIDPTAITGTRTTLKSAQTADRTVNLPDADDTLVGRDTTDTLTNKTIDGDDNALQDIDLPSLKTQLADAGKFLERDGAGTVVSGHDAPGGVVVGDTDTQTLTNKTIDGTSATGTNTITADASNMTYDPTTSGLTATDSQAAIDEVEGRLDTAETGKLEGPGTHADNLLIKTDGVDTNDSQVTGITIDDSNNITGVNDLTVTGDLTVNGTTTSVNSTNLEVTDANITVNNNGNDASSEGAGLTVERTGTDGSLVYEDALTSKFKIGAIGAEVEVADVSSTQTITNKNLGDSTNVITNASADSFTRETGNQQAFTIPDHTSPDTLLSSNATQEVRNKSIVGQTYSATDRIILSSGTTAGLESVGGAEGTIAYNDETKSIVYRDDNGWRQVGTGSGGINYITNPNAETGINDWVAYDDTNQVPTDGTGGSPTISVGTGTPVVRGQDSFSLNHPSSDIQGQGFSTDFTIDNIDKNKPLQVSFDYITDQTLGTYASGDLKVYIYDVTNATLLGTVENGDDGDVITDNENGGSFVGRFTATDASDYRFILHNASTSVQDYQFLFDNVRVGPIEKTTVTAMSDWVDYTPTGGWSGQGTYKGRYRRVGDSIEVEGSWTASAAPVGGFTFDLPPGLSIDATKVSDNGGTAADQAYLGSGRAFDQPGVAITDIGVVWSSAAGVRGLAPTGVLSPTLPFAFNSGDTIAIRFTVPIQGWKSTNVLSNFEANLQTISARYRMGTQSQTTLATVLNFNQQDYDPFGIVTTGPGWNAVIPRKGKYRIQAQVAAAPAVAEATENLFVVVNGVIQVTADQLINTNGFDSCYVDVTLELEKNDVVDIRSANTQSASLVNDSFRNFVEIHSVPDFTTFGVVAETEYIAAEVNVAPNTTTADVYVDTDGSITLSPGTWDIGYDGSLFTEWVSNLQFVYHTAAIRDSSNNVISGTVNGGGMIMQNIDNLMMVPVSAKTRITITTETTYKLSYRASSGNAFSITTMGTDPFTGGLTSPDLQTFIWARRIK